MEDYFGPFWRFSTIGIDFGNEVRGQLNQQNAKFENSIYKALSKLFFVQVSSIVREANHFLTKPYENEF